MPDRQLPAAKETAPARGKAKAVERCAELDRDGTFKIIDGR